ncbi:MAG: hypothetical protein ACLR78_00800 [Roseburia sp.]
MLQQRRLSQSRRQRRAQKKQWIYCDPVYDFGQLHEQNEDIYAWIVVPGTQVDYPLLQSETDNYYPGL